MKKMPKLNATPQSVALKLAKQAFAELLIIILCLCFATQLGSSNEPLFDVVGPDKIPLVVISVILVLSILEIGRKFIHLERDIEVSAPPGARVPAALFIVATLVYVAILANAILPYSYATAAYFCVTSLIIVSKITVREIGVAIGAGLAVGLSLQYLFTEIFIIDLPT